MLCNQCLYCREIVVIERQRGFHAAIVPEPDSNLCPPLGDPVHGSCPGLFDWILDQYREPKPSHASVELRLCFLRADLQQCMLPLVLQVPNIAPSFCLFALISCH